MISTVFTLYFRFLAFLLDFLYKEKDILILDIDNTIACTFESLIIDNSGSNRDRLMSLKPKEKVISYYKRTYPGHHTIFLSARSYKYYWISFEWLRKNGICSNFLHIILVPRADAKLWFLELFTKNRNVIYFDDLSYNHENDNVLLYQDVIDSVKGLKLKYYNYEDILNIEKVL